MWMTAGKPRYTSKIIRDENGDFKDLTVKENHKVDPLAPLELDLEPATSDAQARLYVQVFSSMHYMEFVRGWNERFKLAEPLEELRKKAELESGNPHEHDN